MPDELIRPFDHSDIAALPEYAAASQALDALPHALPDHVDRDRWVQVVREMAIALAYSDGCDTGIAECDTRPAPFAATIDEGWVTGRHRCPECRRTWTCGYSTSLMDMIG